MSTSATLSDTYDLNEDERAAVAVLDADDAVVTVHTDGREVPRPANASRAVRRLLHDLATGRSVHVVSTGDEMTTQQAADVLGMSRTYVVRLIDQGTLPAHLVGTHRRLNAVDVLTFKQERQAAIDGLQEITDADEELGLTY